MFLHCNSCWSPTSTPRKPHSRASERVGQTHQTLVARHSLRSPGFHLGPARKSRMRLLGRARSRWFWMIRLGELTKAARPTAPVELANRMGPIPSCRVDVPRSVGRVPMYLSCRPDRWPVYESQPLLGEPHRVANSLLPSRCRSAECRLSGGRFRVGRFEDAFEVVPFEVELLLESAFYQRS